MKAHLVSAASAAIMLLSTSHAAQAKSGNTPKPAAQEFNALTGEWKSARPKPVVQKYPPSTSLPKYKEWPWRRVAMQPFRFLVMAAKVPLIPAGCLAINGSIAHANIRYGADLDFVDFGLAFEDFDPGPAIDADLDRMERRRTPKHEYRPSPTSTRLQISSAKPASSVSPSGIGKTAMKNRERTTLSVPFHFATAKRSPAGPSTRETAGISPVAVRIPSMPNLDIHLRSTAPELSLRELSPALWVDTDLDNPGVSVAADARHNFRDEVALNR